MEKLIVNIEFQKTLKKEWKDTAKRVKHLSDRMSLRGISVENIKDAVNKGIKKIRSDGSIVSEFRWYKIIYREFNIEGFKKIYPITVIEV